MWGRRQLISVILTLTVCVKSGQQQTSPEKLKVEIYFESLCPDSYNFIKNQLYKNWNALSPYINLKLIPFGKSHSIQDSTEFICQHGPQECKGNRILSCALKRIPNQDLQVEFINCFMEIYRLGRDGYGNEFTQQCFDNVAVNGNEVMEKCYLTDEGTIHQLEAEHDTGRIALKFVPTIIYNGVFDQQLQDASLVNFRDVICSLIKKSFPGSCSVNDKLDVQYNIHN